MCDIALTCKVLDRNRNHIASTPKSIFHVLQHPEDLTRSKLVRHHSNHQDVNASILNYLKQLINLIHGAKDLARMQGVTLKVGPTSSTEHILAWDWARILVNWHVLTNSYQLILKSLLGFRCGIQQTFWALLVNAHDPHKEQVVRDRSSSQIISITDNCQRCNPKQSLTLWPQNND